MASADLTRRALAVGAQDATTGQFASTFATSTIDGSIDPAGALLTQFGAFVHTGTKHSMLTPDTVYVGDEITDASSNQYRIISRERIPWLDQFIGYKCGLEEKTLDTDSPVTSGTWSTTSKDPRERTKTWLDTYLSSAAFTLDNNSTAATYVTYWEGVNANIPIQKILSSIEGGLNYDFIIMIGVPDIEPAYTHWKQIYKFIETVHLKVCAIDKSGLTGTKLVHKVADNLWSEINAHGYAAGTLRQCRQSKIYFEQLAGGQRLWCQDVIVKYQRANELYTATYPVMSYGSDFCYDGDRIAGGVEGSWSEVEDGNTGAYEIVNDDYLQLTVSASAGNKIYFFQTGTNLSMSTNTFTKIRWRYRTSNTSIKAKIRVGFTDATGQDVLAESSSTSWTTGSATLTADKTIALIYVYANASTGWVQYDFIQVYKGNFTFPNVVELEPPMMVEDVQIPIPGRSGELTQIMGNKLLEVNMTVDTEIEPAGLSWKRSGDYNNIDVLLDNCLEGGQTNTQGSRPWEWVDLGNPTIQMKARLVEVTPSYRGDNGLVKLKFREYRLGGANSYESIIERLSLDQ